MIGIYCIINTENGHKYIGSSVDMLRRFREHRSELRRGVHYNRHLQNAWKKYGKDSFEFSAIKEINAPEKMLRIIESLYIINMGPEYNVLPNAVINPMTGRTHTTEARKLMGKPGKSHHMYGKKHSPETRRKMSRSQTGKVLSQSRKENISKGNIGKQAGEKHWNSRLSHSQVLFARFLRDAWDIPYSKLGKYFGVSKQTIHDAVTGRTWGGL